MTPSERARLAKIVSYGLFQGQSDAEIERRLVEYGQEPGSAALARALLEGALGQERAVTMLREGQQGAVVALTRQAGEEVRRYDLSVRFRIGPNEETDWRQVTLSVGAGATREQTRAAIRSAIGTALAQQGEQGSPGAVPGAQFVPGTEDIVYAVPVFFEG